MNHNFILEFLVSESTCYTEANKQVVFILDLMKLDVPDLFYDRQGQTSVPGENFKEYLQQYIHPSALSEKLLKCMDTIMVSWFDCEVF